MAIIYFDKSSLTSGKGYLQGQLEYSYTQSISGNTSTITCTVYVKKDCDSMVLNQTTNGTFTYSLNVNGETITGSKKLEILTTYLSIGSFTRTIEHNNNGTKDLNITGYVTLSSNSSSAYYKKQSNINTTITLTTIPRASAITSASNITLGNACNIKWTPADSSFKYKINFSLGSWSYTTGFISPGSTSAYTYDDYTISGTTAANNTTIYAQLPSSTSGTMTATLTTHNSSGTVIGSSSSKTFTVTIPNTVLPSIETIALDPVNITTVDGTSRNILVKGKNKLVVSVSGCKAGEGSTIKSYTFSGQNLSSTISSTAASASATSNVISSIGSLTYTVKITDARGRTASKTATITCHDYDTPTFKSFTAYRCNLDGTANDNGTYIKYSFAVDYSSVNSTNKSTVAIYYKQNANNSWTSAANALTSSTTKTADDIVKNTSGTEIVFNADTTYAIYATVVDNYSGSTNSSTITVFGASRVLNIRANGTGIAFGKMAETDHLFESKWPLKIDDEIKFGSGVQGRLYTDETDGKNIVYIQTGQEIIGGTTMGLAIHAGSQGSETDVSSPSVYVENSANSGLVNLGSNGRKWNQLYAVNDTIATSDRNVKTDIVNMTYTQEQLFNKLQPVTFKFVNGTSGRTHYGFVSQDVEGSLNELALTGKDFAGFCKDLRVNDDGSPVLDEDGNKIYDYALRYSEFIALNTYMIQKLQNEIVELKAEIAELKSTTQN